MKSFSLKESVATLEDGIIVLSGPCLAVSGIVAGVDLVTGGNILRSYPQLTLAWAITLLLTLDFQVLALGVRAHRVYASSKSGKQKVFEMVLAVLVAAAISYVSIQMQSIIARVNAEGVTIDQAAISLGINTIALIWERSSLVLVLIFMSGWLREHDTHTVEASTPSPAQPSISDETMQAILARLAKVDELEQALQRVTVEALQENGEGLRLLESGMSQHQENGGKIKSKRDAVLEAADRHPGASVEEIAHIANCSIKTAAKWLPERKEAC